jgi:hypothetical protein
MYMKQCIISTRSKITGRMERAISGNRRVATFSPQRGSYTLAQQPVTTEEHANAYIHASLEPEVLAGYYDPSL